MRALNFEELIINGIKNLPAETLREIADYIFFIRKKTLNPKAFDEEIRYEMLNDEMRTVSNYETTHLEEEFIDYKKKYPIE
ncbi:MAG: hypothetical protein FVQ77_15835 [Cytophagales bacterium]|nr:hypothetical protein [Cytophagales bacterium]